MSISKNLGNVILDIESDIHGKNHWFGKSADQSGTNWATENKLTAYQAISGSNDFGGDASNEALILGSTDTPHITNHTIFSMHGLLIVDVSVSTEYVIRFIWGTGTMGEAITADNVSSTMAKFDSVNPQLSAGIELHVNLPELAAGTKIWVQVKNATDNATLDFYVAIIEHN